MCSFKLTMYQYRSRLGPRLSGAAYYIRRSPRRYNRLERGHAGEETPLLFISPSTPLVSRAWALSAPRAPNGVKTDLSIMGDGMPYNAYTANRLIRSDLTLASLAPRVCCAIDSRLSAVFRTSKLRLPNEDQSMMWCYQSVTSFVFLFSFLVIRCHNATKFSLETLFTSWLWQS